MWIEYEDANGRGLAEIDALVEFGDLVVVVEVKLSDKHSDARWELVNLYGPLADFLYPGRRVILVEAYRYCSSADAEHILPLVLEPKRISRLHYLH